MLGKRDRRIGDGWTDALRITEETIIGDICGLLDEIHGFYETALRWLPIEKDPSLGWRLLKAGVCFGPLDPVSNIIANTISYSPSPVDAEAEAEAEAEAQTRESIISKIITDTSDDNILDLPMSPSTSEGATIARRSLQGLIAALIFQFRYLPQTEALRYLRLARADLIVAVWLIKLDRHRLHKAPEFCFNFLTTRVALRCAAVSARHPNPDALVSASLSLASRLDRVSNLLPTPYSCSNSPCHPLSRAVVKRLGELLGREHKTEKLADHWHPLLHASYRFGMPVNPSWEVEGEKGLAPNTCTTSLKLCLLDKIHELYLKALSQLPANALRNRYHRSLLKGGYCFGRLDPVMNIILNTLWYEAKFPTHSDCVDFEVEMICTRMMMRIECCSLYGLVALLRVRVPSLTDHQAVWFLLMADAEVEPAINMARIDGHAINPSNETLAYREAAAQAWHPDPEAMADYLTSSDFCALSLLMQGIAVHSFEFLARLFSEKVQCHELNQTSASEILSKNQMAYLLEVKAKFKADQNFFVRKVNAALKRYAEDHGESYALHVICGVNTKVTEGPVSGRFVRKNGFKYFHINFLATHIGTGKAPVLFFAECSNDDEDEEASALCVPFDPYASSWMTVARCFYCEFEGVKIVHPCDTSFNGLCEDFNKMALGEHSISNEAIISSYNLHSDMMCILREDWIFFDPNMDDKIAEMNQVDSCSNLMWRRKTRIH